MIAAGGAPAAVTIEYDDAGRLRDFACGAQSLVPEDRALCGFGGKTVEVALYGQRGGLAEKRTLRDGKLLRIDAFNEGEEMYADGSRKVVKGQPD